MSKSPEYTLHYFDARVLGEPIRYILKLKNIPFKDDRMPVLSIPAVTPPEALEYTKYAQLPVLQVDDEYISHSQVIVRYLGRKYDLQGKTEMDAIRCEEFVAGAAEFFQLWSNVILYGKTDEIKEEVRGFALAKGHERYVQAFNKALEENAREKGGDDPIHLVGDNITYADIYVASLIDTVQLFFQVDYVGEFPLIQRLINTVYATPGIREHIQDRPVTPF